MDRKNDPIFLNIFLLVGILILAYGCVQNNSSPERLEEVQINEYEGEDLSSIDDFRENSIKGPQYINESSYNLKVSGLVENPEEYSYMEVVDGFQRYEKVVRLDCVEGWSVNILWEGVLVRDIISQAKPKEDASIVIFHAQDGYTTSFPIEYFYDNDIIMAYRMNNVSLPPERGYPFQLVAESKWGYKWIKWITEVEFSDDEAYQGYWERRGYADEGNLNESFID
ncbi:MAG: molybdopterin-dependent oxidoreductase [Candidatus Micrarchaeota archaeon]